MLESDESSAAQTGTGGVTGGGDRRSGYSPEAIMAACSGKLDDIELKFGTSGNHLAKTLVVAFGSSPGEDWPIAEHLAQMVREGKLLFDWDECDFYYLSYWHGIRRGKSFFRQDAKFRTAIIETAIAAHTYIGSGPTPLPTNRFGYGDIATHVDEATRRTSSLLAGRKKHS